MRKKNLVINTLLSFLSEVVPLLAAAAALPLLVADLGTERFGILALVWLFMWYVTVFDLGLGRATTKQLSEAIGRGEKESIPGIVWTSIWIQTALATAATTAMTTLAPYLVQALNVPVHLAAETTTTIRLVALAVAPVMATSTLKGVLEAAQRFDLVALVKTPASLSTYLLSVAGVLAGWRLPGIMLLLLISKVVVMAVFFALDLRLFPALGKSFAFDRHIFRSLLRFGGWATVSSFAAPVLGYLDRFTITHYLSLTALSYYVVPADTLSRLIMIPASMTAVLFPAYSSVATTDRAKLLELFSRPLKYLLPVMTPIAVTLIVFAHPILEAWMGRDFARQGTLPMQILAVSICINSFALIPYTAIHGLGRPEFKAKLDLVELPLYLGLNLILIPSHGIGGAAAARLAITGIDFLALLVIVKRYLGITWGEILPLSFRYGLGITLLFVATSAGLAHFDLPLVMQIAALSALSAIYLFWFFRSSLDQVDRMALAPLLRSGTRTAAPAAVDDKGALSHALSDE